MAHDSLFKTLLRIFFYDFLLLFLPTVAAGIDPAAIDFLDTQTFTDLPQGRLRIADQVAELHALADVEDVVLLHVEVQTEDEPGFDYRIWEYNALLTLRTRHDVISVGLFPFAKRRKRRLQRYAKRRFGRLCHGLEYQQARLGSLRAAEYLARDIPLGWALAALMRRGPGGTVELKSAIIRRLRESSLDEARLFVLVNVVETYLPLSEVEQAALRAEGDGSVEATELTWADKMMERGRAQGIEQGILQAKREVVARLVRNRFGSTPADLEAFVAGADVETLDVLLDRVVEASNLEDFTRLL